MHTRHQKPLNSFLLVFSLIFLITSSNAQPATPRGGGEYKFQADECISPVQRKMIDTNVEQNIIDYKIKITKSQAIIKYEWPIKQNPTFDYNSTYAISNFVDHNAGSGITDYNCGDYTYDGHRGIDISLWPFEHQQVANEQTWAVAGAAGTIIDKHDGEKDDNCNGSNSSANYIILMHADGSRSLYWHLKKNRLTSKGIGTSVASGEFLGVIASSGNSTGPHLHFECYDANEGLIDPYSGSCNNMNSQSYWTTQKPLWEPTINTLLTHNAEPNFGTCPNPETTNVQTIFEPGDLVFFASYFHDQRSTSNTSYVIKYPNGSIWMSWNHQPGQDYRSSWWADSYFLPNNAPEGQYTFQATLDAKTVTRNFEVKSCPAFYNIISSQIADGQYETDGTITAKQLITSGVNVNYDSGTSITFEKEYEIQPTGSIEAIIDGCGCIDVSKKNQHPTCVLIYAPVCGCDGVTYSNYCVAENAGVILYQQGACE